MGKTSKQEKKQDCDVNLHPAFHQPLGRVARYVISTEITFTKRKSNFKNMLYHIIAFGLGLIAGLIFNQIIKI